MTEPGEASAEESGSADAGQEQGDDVFAYFSLNGDRFDEVGMPADTAREVGYFKQAVLELAKQLWKDANPGRIHVPAGFEAGFDLRLIGVVEPGSAKPQMVLRRPKKASDEWSQWREFYGLARDRYPSVIKEASASGALPAGLNDASRKALRRVGSSLDGPESLTAGHPTETANRATLDESTRQILRQIDEVVPPTPAEHRLVGVVTEYDGGSLSFQLKTDSGLSTCVLEKFNSRLANFAKDVLALDGVTAPDVEVVGETLDPDRRSVHLYNVHEISLVRSVEEKALANRLADLQALASGWNGPGSLAIADDVADSINLVLSRLAMLEDPVDLIPGEDGSVTVEVTKGPLELAAVVSPLRGMTLVVDNVETDELGDLRVAFDAEVLLEFLRRGVIPR